MAKKMKPRILVASSENVGWEQIYIDGKQGYGNHSVGWQDVLDALGIEWDTAEVSEEWLDKHHYTFPKLAKNLPK